jgi:hypothetical protein
VSAAPQRFAPEFALEINGQAIPAGLRASITSVQLEDGVPSMMETLDANGMKAADRVEVAFANVDLRWLRHHIRGLGFQPFPTHLKLGPARIAASAATGLGPGPALVQQALDLDVREGLFDIDNRLALALGYAQQSLEDVFLGEITGVEADFPASGMPTMRLIAHDYLHRLAEGSYARGFSPLLPDWLVAAVLSAENLLLPAIDPAVAAASTTMTVLNAVFDFPGRPRMQRGSDLQLLKQIADAYDADFWVDGDVLVLSRFVGKEFEPRLTLVWGESLLSLTPHVSTIGQVVGVAVKFTVPMIPIDFLMTVGWDFDRESLNVRIVPGAAAAALKTALGGPVRTLMNRKLDKPGDIAAAAIALTRVLRRKVNTRLTASGTAVGDPRLRAGAMVRLDGLGPDFSGNYRITSATHTLDASSGYRVAFKACKEILP